VLDYYRDGRLDLVFVNGGGRPVLRRLAMIAWRFTGNPGKKQI